jgi:DNA invertase Pin-like site-specific DNA recombinase
MQGSYPLFTIFLLQKGVRPLRTEKSPEITLMKTVNKAFLYCSLWPDENPQASLDAQSVELQAYCLINGLEVVGLGQDIRSGKPGAFREGFESLLIRAKVEGIQHIVLLDPTRLLRDPEAAFKALMGETLPSGLTLHIAAWQTHTQSVEAKRWLMRMKEWLNQSQKLLQAPKDLSLIHI